MLKILRGISGKKGYEKMQKKDMYLPVWVCILGVVFLIAGVVCIVLSIAKAWYNVIWALALLCIGAAAILCWRNQWAEMVNDQEFVYSTMFGRHSKHRFSEIRGIKQNSDSMTLLLENGKIHIESCAVISDRFANRINSMLEAQ